MVVTEENDTHVWDHRCRPAAVRPAAAGAGGPARHRGAGRRRDPFCRPRRGRHAALVGAKDGLWAICCDRIASVAAVAALVGRYFGRAAMEVYGFIQIALVA